MRSCFILGCLDKSHSIGIETCNVFYCVAVSLQVSMQIRSNLSKQPRVKQQRIEATRTCLCITIRLVQLAISVLQYDLICPDGDFSHIGAVKQLARFYTI